MSSQSQIADFSAEQIETTLRLARISLDSFEHVVKLQLDSAKHSLEEGVQLAQAMANAKDWQDAVALRQKAVESFVEHSLGWFRDFYGVAAKTQSELSLLAEERAIALNKQVATGVENFTKSAPAGADVAVAAIKSSVQAAAAAVDSITKTAKQVAHFADASVKAATTATTDAIKATTRSATKHHTAAATS